jgi:hypothetical protein
LRLNRLKDLVQHQYEPAADIYVGCCALLTGRPRVCETYNNVDIESSSHIQCVKEAKRHWLAREYTTETSRVYLKPALHQLASSVVNAPSVTGSLHVRPSSFIHMHSH